MKKNKVIGLLFLILLSIILHGYLTSHYYPLHYGIAQEPAGCNISEKFNCDAVAASPYAQVLGIPLSVFGIITHIVLLFLVLGWWLSLADEPKVWLRSALGLSLVSLLASLVMGAISATQLSTYCLVCIFLYFLSFGIFFLLLRLSEKPHPQLFDCLQSGKVPLGLIVSIPLVAWLTHKSVYQGYDGDKLELALKSLVEAWERAPQSSIEETMPSFVMGAKGSPKMVIAEFADFRCGHCKFAAPTLHAFVKAHEKHVQLRFFSFPLDGDCNDLVPGGDGISCLLASAVICAETAQQGRDMHDQIFAAFNEFSRTSKKSEVKSNLTQMAEKLGLESSQFEECLAAVETRDQLKAQIKLGDRVGVKGTPTILVNGKKLNQGQRLMVLEKVFSSLK